MSSLYSGRLDPSRPSLRQLLGLLGMAVMEQEEVEDEKDEDREYLEPVMHLNIGTALPGLPPGDQLCHHQSRIVVVMVMIRTSGMDVIMMYCGCHGSNNDVSCSSWL